MQDSNPEGIDIRSEGIISFPDSHKGLADFRTKVDRCSYCIASNFILFLLPGAAEVPDFVRFRGANEDVFRLYVSVSDTLP